MVDEGKTKILEPGDKFGDYTVVKLLGKGGMGAVYLMRGASGSEYAVKIMFPDKVTHDLRRRFAKEAEFAIKIRHRNLVSVYDVGEDPETGLCYMIMDYVAGGSLSDMLKRRGRLPIGEAVSIASQVAAALEVAHRHGLVHRDIKPDNILFDADGTPRLADLGVAKFDESQQSMVTTTGMVIGTPAYMAPEQMLNSHAIDARADIYSLGVVLYEMLSGKRPNEGRTAIELMAKAIKGDPLPDIKTLCPELSAAVAHVVSLLCAPKPEARPQTALAAADILRKAASGKFVLLRKKPQSSTAEDAARRAKSRKLVKGVAIGIGIAAFLFVGIAGWVKALSRSGSAKVVAATSVTNVVERVAVVTNVVANTNAATLPQRTATLAHRWSFNGKAEEENLTDSVGGVVATKIGNAVAFEAGQAVLSGDGHGAGSLNLGKGILGADSATIEIWATRTAFRKWARIFDYGIGSTYFMMTWNTAMHHYFRTELSAHSKKEVRHRLPLNDDEEVYIAVVLDSRDDGDSVVQWTVCDPTTGMKKDSGSLNFQNNDFRLSGFVQANFYLGHSQFPADADANAKYNEVRIWRGVLSDAAIARNVKLGPNASKAELEASVMLQGAAGDDRRSDVNAELPHSAYVSRSALHAAYRSKDRKRVFVETVHGEDHGWLKTPPCTLERVKEYMTDGTDIIWLRIGLTKDGVLFAVRPWDLQNISDGQGHVSKYTAEELQKLRIKRGNDYTDAKFVPLEELLQHGRNKVLFKLWYQTGRAKSVLGALVNLLNRLDAWESVILEMWGKDPAATRAVIGEEIWHRLCSGELQIMVHPDIFHEWVAVAPECSAWVNNWIIGKCGLPDVQPRMAASFVVGPGEARRTDDDAGWTRAINDGVTVFRTRRPRELKDFLEQRRIAEETQASSQSAKPDMKGRAWIRPAAGKAKTTVAFPCLDRSPTAWAYSFEEKQGWERPDFDDSQWKRAPGGFGHREDLKQLPRARLNTDWWSDRVFLRKRFKWDGGDISRVVVDAYLDDEMTIWVNGQRMLTVCGANFDWQPFEIPASCFANAVKKGENVFCVEVRDQGGWSYFDCGLLIECGGAIASHAGPDGMRKVKSDVGTWTVVVKDGIAQIGDGRNVALEPQPKGSLKIPSELDGLAITKLAQDCFIRCGELKRVEIPEGVRSIGQGAFLDCSQLTEVQLPTTLEHFGSWALKGTALRQIDLKEVRLMESAVFESCDKLETVKLSPDNVKFRVKDGVLYDVVRRAVVFCPSSRREYAFPAGIEEICNSAFLRTKLKKVVIPETVEFISWNAFAECPFLESVVFKGADVIIRGGAFANTPFLKTVVLPSRLKALDDWAIFAHAGQLETIVLPDTVEIIDDAVFENCFKLKKVHLGQSLRQVDNRAFSGCRELQKIQFPKTLEELGAEVFLNCVSLKSVSFAGGKPKMHDNGKDSLARDLYRGTPSSLVTLVPKGSTGWLDGSANLPKVWPVDGGESARQSRHDR